ncbi:AbrB/MazE/SpoVT family DNA-binding domain-containing protein [Amycolatopsis sp. NPDC059657]|uniref:AbrB/MazE/SpoVT family DNA-binding domain-containing protein n=1 Tax=Amycolatopsis sp. NPDC059657 TaxID=3346899 RepID=UPI003672C772
MSGPIITPLALPAISQRQTTASPAPRRRLPLASVPTPRTSAAVYGLAAVDRRGRVADHAILRALGWTAGTRLDITENCGLLVIRSSAAHGMFSVTNQGHLRLPAPVRHYSGLVPGDRVLLAADPARDLLVVHPPAALDDLLAQRHAELLGGELA